MVVDYIIGNFDRYLLLARAESSTPAPRHQQDTPTYYTVTLLEQSHHHTPSIRLINYTHPSRTMQVRQSNGSAETGQLTHGSE